MFSILCLIAAVSSKLAGKLGVPALLVFIFIGILAGTDGLCGVYFDNYYLAQFIGIIALSYILFMGGLSIDTKNLKPIFIKGMALATVGVLITAILTGAIGYYFLNFNILECLLLGCIVSSTDAAAVFSVLRSKNISLKNDLKPLLEFESGSNDPMAAFLTIAVISLITGQASGGELTSMFFQQMLIGVISGYVIGKFSVKLINKIQLEYTGLYVVLTLAIVPFAYALPSSLGGNGFMSVYVAGLTMAAGKFVHKKMLTKFHDGIAWFMQIIMFLVLGLMVFVKEAVPIAPKALFLTLVLIFIARPVAVFISMLAFKMDIREKLMISWVGLRGAAPIVLAAFPLISGIPNAKDIFSIVFFVVIISIIIQGSTVSYAAKLLNVDSPYIKDLPHPIEFDAGSSNKKMFEIQIQAQSETIGKTVDEIQIPKDSLITMISRDDEYHIPSGKTRFEECDILFILSENQNENKIKEIFKKSREK